MQLAPLDSTALLEIGVDCACEEAIGTAMCSRDSAASEEELERMSMPERQSGRKKPSLDGAHEPSHERTAPGDGPIFAESSKRPLTAASEEDDEQDNSSLCALSTSSADSSEVLSQLSSCRPASFPARRTSAANLDSFQVATTNTESLTPRPTKKGHEASDAALLDAKNRSRDVTASELQRPDALSFLENDSPPVTEERILQAIAQASENWSPRSISSFGSIDSSERSSAATDATTPDQSVSGDSPPPTALPRPSELCKDATAVSGAFKAKRGNRTRRPQLHPHLDGVKDRYGTPEMARGPAKHPHFPPNELQPRLVAPGQGYPKYLPRAEKLPMTGYELLSAKLSTSDPWTRRRGSSGSSQSDEGPTIKPIYRRFEALNHRLLLHLQDELNELEEQLHRLDTADTQTRRLQNCILPASRRAESMAGGELQWRKTDTLGKIGFKLGQYNHALESFTKTMNLPPASMSDIEDYRTYLATHAPIAEVETRFLDPADDLICLAPDRAPSSTYSRSPSPLSETSDGLLTPVPHRLTFSAGNRHSRSSSCSSNHVPVYAKARDVSPPSPPSPQRQRQQHPDHASNSSAVDNKHDLQAHPNTNTAPTAATATHSPLNHHDHDHETTTSNTTTTSHLQSYLTDAHSHPQPHLHPQSQNPLLTTLAVILLPLLAFSLTTDSAGRMAVLFVAGLAVSALRRGVNGGVGTNAEMRGVEES